MKCCGQDGKKLGSYKGAVAGYYAGTNAVNKKNAERLGSEAGIVAGILNGGYIGYTYANQSITTNQA